MVMSLCLYEIKETSHVATGKGSEDKYLDRLYS
jgi:translation elongation factor P/translation initiation factor 5A